MAAKVTIAELRNHVSRYVRRASGGERIVILNRTREVAELVPPTMRRADKLVGALKGTARVHGDLVRARIPADEWFRT